MRRFLYLFGVFCFFIISLPVSAQNHHLSGRQPSERRQALVISLESRVLEDERRVVWNEVNRKVSLPGVPVGVQLSGSNVVVAVQFTPYIRRSGNVLVAQGQIWIADAATGVTYYTSMQTIPFEFNEPVHFYPLGLAENLSPSIEIILTVNRYNEASALPGTAANPGNDR